MAKKGFVPNEKNIGGILNGTAMEDEMERRTAAVAAAAGEGFDPSVQRGRVRIQASVVTATAKARRREQKRRILERAVDAGRA